MLIAILSFVFVLGILIFIHELGHFIVAKRVGIKVHKFSLGFPPTIVSKTIGDTEYSIGLIPLGGFVKMAGENPDEEATGASHEFGSKSIAQRAAVIIAGPFMNYVLAITIMIGIFYLGGRPVYEENRVVVGEVFEGKPAYEAGLRTDDVVIGLDGVSIANYDSLRLSIYAHKTNPLELTWLRGLDTMSAVITPQIEMVMTAEGEMDSIGMIGFGQKAVRYENYGLGESISKGFMLTHVMLVETVSFVKKFATGQVSRKMIGGPLFIAQQSGKEASKGATNLFYFMALLSINLAVLNVLPIPILDGGHLVFLAVELVKGSPLPMKTRIVAQQVGMLLLLSLIVFVTYNDIMRVFSG